MKKLFDSYSKILIRPILYRSITWGSIALAAALVWERFVSVKSFLSVGRDIFFLIGVIFLALAWFYYLKIDGISPPKLKTDEMKKKPKRFGYGDIIDFADEHVVTFDELSDEEQDLCKLATNLLLGCIFLLTSFFA